MEMGDGMMLGTMSGASHAGGRPPEKVVYGLAW